MQQGPTEVFRPSAPLVFLLAAACGLTVANIYYVQPLIGLIAPALGIDPSRASWMVTLTQLGYASGLLLLVPLGDMLENRRLLVVTVVASVPALLAAGLAQNSAVFLIAGVFIGLTSVSVQMLLPLAAHLTSDHTRGRVVGNIMSGLLLGILLARPVASLIADAYGWRAVFVLSSALMAGLACVLWRFLPYRQPETKHHYGDLLKSLGRLPVAYPILLRLAIYQAAAFACISLFWTAVPLFLMHDYGFHQRGIAGFALIGAGGALFAPIAGRLADRGVGRRGSLAAMLAIVMAYLLAGWGGLVSHSVWLMAFAGVLLDAGVQFNLVFSQRTIYALAPALRSRMNGVFIAIFFVGGAFGSVLVSPLLARIGWAGICALGVILPLSALAYLSTERPGMRIGGAN